MQDFGEAGRQFDRNIWLHSVGRRIVDNSKNILYVITDCRFPNEVEYIQKLGGCVVRLERSNIEPSTLAGRDTQHVSETALDGFAGFDHVIQNDGTLEDLEIALLELIKR